MQPCGRHRQSKGAVHAGAGSGGGGDDGSGDGDGSGERRPPHESVAHNDALSSDDALQVRNRLDWHTYNCTVCSGCLHDANRE